MDRDTVIDVVICALKSNSCLPSAEQKNPSAIVDEIVMAMKKLDQQFETSCRLRP